jgi:hypothetical protein
VCDTVPTAPECVDKVRSQAVFPSSKQVVHRRLAHERLSFFETGEAMKTIFDPSFRYASSFNTDLKKTFARLRRDRRQDPAKSVPAPAVGLANVSSIVPKIAGRC